MPTACKTERRLGTMAYLWFFLMNSKFYSDLFVQVLFIGLMYLITYIPGTFWPSGYLVPCVGLWPIIMIEMVVRCNRNPEDAVGYDLNRLFFCPLTIKSKYYPLAILRTVLTAVWSGVESISRNMCGIFT